MPHWHVSFPEDAPKLVHLVHTTEDEDGPVWSGTIEIWRGAPSWRDKPELEHAMLGVINPAIHRDFIRHQWEFDLPDRYADRWNCGEMREFATLTATGGFFNWQLVLRFPAGFRTPDFVFRAIVAGFGATIKDVEPAAPEVLEAPPERTLAESLSAIANSYATPKPVDLAQSLALGTDI